MNAYLAAVAAEFRRRASFLAPRLKSVYLGGGTPTVLGARRLESLLAAVTGRAEAEISVEANPGTVDADVAGALARAGVNRVTLGAQSFDDAELAFLGRIHRRGDVARAADVLRSAGIETLAMDLIYGLPGQSLSSWRRSLREALALGPEHVSCYALSIEPGTALGDDLAAGRIEEADDEIQRRMYDEAMDSLASTGYEHYELSNFAQPGRRCRHNLVYWRNGPYLGLGPGACSYLDGERIANAPDLRAYLTCLLARPSAPPPATSERLTGRKALAETLMLGLRLLDGVAVADIVDRFGVGPIEAFPQTFSRYIDQGAVVATPARVRLHREALFTANCILADLLDEAQT